MDRGAHLKHKTLPDRDLRYLLSSASAALAETQKNYEDPAEDGVFRQPSSVGNYFTDKQRRLLDAVQMQLFPDDGNGPSARDLNALPYLEWAITDPVNVNDGDPKFIGKGIQMLADASQASHGVAFIELTNELQNEVLEGVSRSKFGNNWLSLLMYYLSEALMLDPYYRGNPDMLGWMWLDHRPGFPRPMKGLTYRDFE